MECCGFLFVYLFISGISPKVPRYIVIIIILHPFGFGEAVSIRGPSIKKTISTQETLWGIKPGHNISRFIRRVYAAYSNSLICVPQLAFEFVSLGVRVLLDSETPASRRRFSLAAPAYHDNYLPPFTLPQCASIHKEYFYIIIILN